MHKQDVDNSEKALRESGISQGSCFEKQESSGDSLQRCGRLGRSFVGRRGGHSLVLSSVYIVQPLPASIFRFLGCVSRVWFIVSWVGLSPKNVDLTRQAHKPPFLPFSSLRVLHVAAAKSVSRRN